MGERKSSKVQYNLFTLRRLLEIKKQRKYNWGEIAQKAGLTRKTLETMANNKSSRVNFSSLEALLDFFRDEGMPIGIEELLSVTYETAGEESESSPN